MAPAPPVKLYDLGQIDYLDEPERADEDDDGMGSARHRYHRSAKILGRLYRGVDEKKIWDRDIHRAVNTDGPSVWDQFTGRMQAELEGLGIALDYARHADDARKLRHLYEEAMSGSMWHFSTNPRESLTEVEVFCGSLLNKRGAQTRQQRDNSTRLKDEADRIQSWMVNLMRRRGGRVEPDSGAESGPDADEPRDDVVQLCWACLVVGCLKDADDGADGGSARRSFRVCAAACLLKEVDALRGAVAGGGFVGVAAGLARRLDGLALG
ncbi:hypothetical protein CDD83_5583 [Cordyceps sp. RAO-2017]|nr:hypothetical protein CDD83_5583 [Cordyceps sp. RAO-2017]